MKIGIDLGHGVNPDRGAVGNIAEETIINAVGSKVISKLKSLGHSVIELRPSSASSVSNSLWQRYTKANNNNVDMCISIHANAGGGKGTEVFTYKGKEVKEARNVLNNIVSLGFNNRGIKDGSNLAMIRNTSSVSMLIEICFVDSSDSSLYEQIGAEKISNAIVKGITGQSTVENKYYIVTNYLKCAYDGYDGVDIKSILDAYFSDVKCYVRSNEKGIWIETQYLSKDKCDKLKSDLGSLFYEIAEE
ncbi:N-acetylmuramoyl-L-alanine amidase [Clostridium sp. SM-530-WT-3G]|uniref:N-acetylmuramoyl-L-alanine amidase n=1 Tax=Clostridium sp. SM-530-WT-3G TaxID=2725303 RepID=UPI00145C74E6|nr:N-acetylmuramoyl-L-alanine amidase [Clostridium sp. SM-530-WT-3G]NME81694.1 N-acetylmuramoyl-L-alanine amidase [Clostridium sp. SM-530-WT-3G]